MRARTTSTEKIFQNELYLEKKFTKKLRNSGKISNYLVKYQVSRYFRMRKSDLIKMNFLLNYLGIGLVRSKLTRML